MFPKGISIDQLNSVGKSTLVDHLGIVLTSTDNNTLTATMPVDKRTIQPYGLLHGGASVVLAETLGSLASNLIIDNELYIAVGLEINANHIRPVKEGNTVTGTASPIHIGRKTHVWEIKINNSAGKLVCISRLTTSIIKKDE